MSKPLALAAILLCVIIAEMSDGFVSTKLEGSIIQRVTNSKVCQECNNIKDIDLTVSYTDVSGNVGMHTINSSALSSSWVWENPGDVGKESAEELTMRDLQPQLIMIKSENKAGPLIDQNQQPNSIPPLKFKRQLLRQRRKEKRAAELIKMNEETDFKIHERVIKRSMTLNITTRGRYNIWRIEYQNPSSDYTLKLMKDQIIMAKVYAGIAYSAKKEDLYLSLLKHISQSQRAIEDASMDVDLQLDALEYAKKMGHALSIAKDVLYECHAVDLKLRTMIQSTESNIDAVKKQNTFLVQHAAKTVPRPLHCLSLLLTTNYHVLIHNNKEPVAHNNKLIDPSLYHYAIFSDNVLATSVVVNSTTSHTKDLEKHVFHIVTDRLNFPAMRMWFIEHPPLPATIEVLNIDDFKWLNSTYCAVLRQLESARVKEYYFKANHPSSLSAENENLKYRNPKYLSMLNHLRFYMPEVYPKLDKILFLDDDIVVQKDLTPIWHVDMKGMVNGAVETCKESFHRFDTYLNFSNPKISENFDPRACGWAFGMNMFDLKEWKRRNITGIYHYWQDLNEDRKLWKLGSLPPGLITFYNLTHPLDRRWHVLGLGYDPAVSPLEIQSAAVIHYNGNYKPWLDLAITKYKTFWSNYVDYDDPYLRLCSVAQ